MFLNHQMLPTYQAYNSFLPPYLHGRPPVIVHCLETSNSTQFYLSDLPAQFVLPSTSGYTHVSTSSLEFFRKQDHISVI